MSEEGVDGVGPVGGEGCEGTTEECMNGGEG